jgi:hypothetical protein
VCEMDRQEVIEVAVRSFQNIFGGSPQVVISVHFLFFHQRL